MDSVFWKDHFNISEENYRNSIEDRESGNHIDTFMLLWFNIPIFLI